jgi:hypothetical protein
MVTRTASRTGRFSTRDSVHYWVEDHMGRSQSQTAPTGNQIPDLRSPNTARTNRHSLSRESHKTHNLHPLGKTKFLKV